MQNLLSIFDKKVQEELIDEQKLRNLASKVAIWDYFCIPLDHYLALDTKGKWKILKEYYKKLVPLYFTDGKGCSFFSLNSWFAFFVADLDYGLFLFFKILLACFRWLTPVEVTWF